MPGIHRTTNIEHLEPGEDAPRPLNEVLDEIISDMDRMKFEIQQLQQAIRNLQTTTQPLNVYGGITPPLNMYGGIKNE